MSMSGDIKLRQEMPADGMDATPDPSQTDAETTVEAATAPKPKGRPRQDDSARRAIILEEAYGCFIEHGYLATTTDLVAARCRMSKQTLYRLFSSKEALFAEVVGRHRQLMIDLPRPEGEDLPFFEALERIFYIGIDEATDARRRGFVRAVMRDATHVPGLFEDFLRQSVGRVRLDLADWLAEQNRLSRARIEKPLSAAHMLMDLSFSPVPPLAEEGSRSEHLHYCLSVFARGVAA